MLPRLLTASVARVWEPSWQVIIIVLLRPRSAAAGALLRAAATPWCRPHWTCGCAERERYLLAGQARADERARLGGEMHSVMTNRLSVLVR